MLAEFSFTRSIFDKTAHNDPDVWRDQLRELGTNMFPRTAAWPVLVSNLYDASWHHVAVSIAEAITDPRSRRLCQDLLESATTALVGRPIAVADWPGDDSLAWGREAIASNVLETIDRIVACNTAHAQLREKCPEVRCIDEVQDGGFWVGITSQWPQSMRIEDQIDAVRKLRSL
jgi:hypothetical protein